MVEVFAEQQSASDVLKLRNKSMGLEIGSKVQSVNSRLGLMGDDTTIIGTVRAFLQREGGLVKVYWPTIKETTFHYGDDLFLIADPKKKKKKRNKVR